MLVAKGEHCWLKLEGGGSVSPRGAMLHDEAGTTWSKHSILFLPFHRSGRPASDAQTKGAPRHYLGREYEIRVGSVDLPPRALSAWTRVGPVERIEYARPGTRAPGNFYHDFGKRRLAGLFRKGRNPVLYKCGRAYRLELGAKSISDSRGIVHP